MKLCLDSHASDIEFIDVLLWARPICAAGKTYILFGIESVTTECVELRGGGVDLPKMPAHQIDLMQRAIGQ